MSCREYTIVLIPFQRIFTKVSHRLSQVRDVGCVSGDIGGVGCHGIVGGFQLRAINRVSAASRQVASGDVGDFAGGISTVCGAECCTLPEEGIILKVANGIRQVGDIGGVSGDIGGVGCHIIIGGFQLRAVNGVFTGSRNIAIFYIDDFVFCYGTGNRSISIFNNITGAESPFS